MLSSRHIVNYCNYEQPSWKKRLRSASELGFWVILRYQGFLTATWWKGPQEVSRDCACFWHFYRDNRRVQECLFSLKTLLWLLKMFIVPKWLNDINVNQCYLSVSWLRVCSLQTWLCSQHSLVNKPRCFLILPILSTLCKCSFTVIVNVISNIWAFPFVTRQAVKRPALRVSVASYLMSQSLLHTSTYHNDAL